MNLEHGLIAVASSSLEPGTVILKDDAFSFILRSDYSNDYCHNCLTKLKNVIDCQDCNYSKSCSKECYNNIGKYHSFICKSLQSVNLIANKSDCDSDLIRIIIELLGKIIFEVRSSVNLTIVWSQLIFHWYFKFPRILSLISNIEYMSQAWKDSVLVGSRLIFELLNSEDQLLLADITAKEKVCYW